MGTTGFTIIDLIILIVYLLAVLVAGIYFSKKEMKGKEFFKGDGSVPWYVTSVSIFATMLSPISFLGLAGNSYAGSWILWFAQLGMVVAVPLTIRFILPIFARIDIDTAYDYLDKRFNSKALRIISALLFIIYQLGRMSIIMYLPSAGLSVLTGIDINILIILMGAIAIVYSYTGGLKSVLWTDFIQGVVLISGVVVALFVLMANIKGGFGAVAETLANGKFLAANEKLFDPNLLSNSIFLIVMGSGFTILSSYASSQDLVQRFTTTQNIKKLNKMLFTNGVLSLATATVFYLIGTGLYVFYQVQNAGSAASNIPQDQIFMYFIAYQLPVGVTGLILAAIYAELPHGKRLGRGHRRRSVAPLARFGLLFARSQPAPSGKTNCRIGAFPQHPRGNLQAKRRWSVHVGGHFVHRFQPSSGGSRWQCVSCFGAFLRHRHAYQLHRRQKTVRHLSPIAFAPPRSGTLQRGHHGLWCTAMLAREGRNRKGKRPHSRAKRYAKFLQQLSVKWSMRGFRTRFGAFATRKNQIASPQTAAHGLHIYKVWGRNCHPKAAGGRHLAGALGAFAIRRRSTFRCTNSQNLQARGH